MSIFRSPVSDPTTWTTKGTPGINCVAAIDADNYIATLVGGGTVVSADKGNSWGSVRVPSIGPLETIYRAPMAAGAAPAGRLWAFDTLNTARLYYSDDNGLSWTAVTAFVAPLGSFVRGNQIVQQQIGATQRLFARPHTYKSAASLFRVAYSDDGGATWTTAVTTNVGVYGGDSGIVIRNDGRILVIGGQVTGGTTLGYVDMSWVWGSYQSSGAAAYYGRKACYHSGDDVVLVALFGGDRKLYVRTLNAGDALTEYPAVTISGSPVFEALDYVTAIDGISGKYVIAARSASTAYWLVSADGDPGSWSVLKSQALSGSGAGILSNCLAVA